MNDNNGIRLEDLVTGKPWQGVCYGMTRRDMAGVSLPPFDRFNVGLHCGDEPVHAIANRQALRQLLPSEPIWLNQVHGTDVLDADLEFDYPAAVDAVVTTEKNKVLAIMTADCVPVVVADTQGTILGVAHAGWRGLQAGVLENLITVMHHKKPKSELRAWIGPAISREVFEVGGEVFEAFMSVDKTVSLFFQTMGNGKYLADLLGIAAHQLVKLGLQQIEVNQDCTFLDYKRYFSYRRENPTGRMVTVAWLTV